MTHALTLTMHESWSLPQGCLDRIRDVHMRWWWGVMLADVSEKRFSIRCQIPDRGNCKMGRGGLHAWQWEWTHVPRETNEVQAQDLDSDSSSTPQPSTPIWTDSAPLSETGQDPFRIAWDEDYGAVFERQKPRNTARCIWALRDSL